jgi:cytochrome P450
VTDTQAALTADEIALSDGSLWERHDREEIFATLRRERPVSFQAEAEIVGGLPPGPGYWALVKYADVMHASRHPEIFCSGKGSNIPDLPQEVNELFGSMINMDAPRHTKLRGVVNRGFTPRMVSKVEIAVRDAAKRIVDDVQGLGGCDFVTEIAAALPLKIICDMMGIPEADYARVFDQSNHILGATDPEYGGTLESAFNAGWDLYNYGLNLANERLESPHDDITSSLMHADVEGERLTAQELGSFFVLLVVAGNETTRNAISHGMKLLTDHPEQREMWARDFEGVAPTAIEEIVRWATPVIHFRRTATRDTEVRGQKIEEGDKVALWYNSANRDEEVFADPYRFDVLRTPNEHVGFGAGGPHFCLGAHLARREMKVMFEEIFKRLPDIRVTSEPQYLLSPFIHGIKHMDVEFTPVKAGA